MQMPHHPRTPAGRSFVWHARNHFRRSLQAAEQLRKLAMHFSGFVVSSKVSGSDERMQSAQVPSAFLADHFDEARAQVRAIAKSVEQDTVEARDVTREYGDQEAALRNARAEEQQYLLILKRAASVKDVLEVSSKLQRCVPILTAFRPNYARSSPSRDVSAHD